MTSDDVNTPYDPELPILAELEQSWRLVARRALEPEPAPVAAAAAAPAAAATPAAPARRRRGSAARVARRAVVLTGLGCLVAASAVATRSLVDGRENDPTLRTSRTVRLADGRVDGQPWLLDGYRRDAEVCYDLVAAGRVATGCRRAPGPRELHIDGTLAPLTRVVIGIVGAEVARVRVSDGAERASAPTRALTSTPGARAAQLPRAVRWFVVTVPRPRSGAQSAGARVTGYDERGQALARQRIAP